MEEPALALILSECLEAMDRGLEAGAAASSYPALAPEMLPLLETAAVLRETRESCAAPDEFLRDLGERLRLAP